MSYKAEIAIDVTRKEKQETVISKCITTKLRHILDSNAATDERYDINSSYAPKKYFYREYNMNSRITVDKVARDIAMDVIHHAKENELNYFGRIRVDIGFCFHNNQIQISVYLFLGKIDCSC